MLDLEIDEDYWDMLRESDEYYRESDEYYEEEPREVPTFGCACVNPLCVDTVCAPCIDYLEHQYEIHSRALQIVGADGRCICAILIGPDHTDPDQIPF